MHGNGAGTAWRTSTLVLLCSASVACGAEESKDGSNGPTVYPPLSFQDIGQPVPVDTRFYRTEGPVWNPADESLYFTDISADTGGAIYRLTLPDSIESFLAPDGNANGLALASDGTLLGAGHAAGNVWRLSNGTPQTLGPCPSSTTTTCFEGQPLNAPNDLVVRSDGTLYFTDPNFAAEGEGFAPENRPLANAEGVYRLTQDGVVHLEDVSTPAPNGIALSPDEKTLYVSYSLEGSVAKFDVATDGTLSNKEPFATGTLIADGLCVDAAGNLYVGMLDGVMVFDVAGVNLGTIVPQPAAVTNCAFGGPDQRTLFITSHATFVAAPGDAALVKVEAMPIPGIAGWN